MMKKNRLTLLWMILFLTGCVNPPTSYHPLASPTVLPQNTLTPAVTRLPEPTLTATPETRFTRQCLPVDDREVDLDLKEAVSGTILLRRSNPGVPPPGDSLLILKDMQTGNEYPLPKDTKTSLFLGGGISPNRKMLAQIEVVYHGQGKEFVQTGNVLWVFDAQAKVVAKMDLHRSDNLYHVYWLDNERLLIETAEYGKLLLVNPFSGEQQLIANELPHLSRYVKNGLWWPVVYSPDLEWVAYDAEDSQVNGPVVYDLVTKQILWHSKFGADSDAAWSPDGQEIALSNSTGVGDKNQLYLISHSGQVKAVLDEDQPHRAFSPSWSPDGHYIAFWNDDSLMVYDRQLDWVFDTCVRGYGGGGYVIPYWSPDNQQMITYGYSKPSIPILVDWKKKVVYKIKDDLTNTTFGWMNSLP